VTISLGKRAAIRRKPGTDTKFPAQFAGNWLSVPGFASQEMLPPRCRPRGRVVCAFVEPGRRSLIAQSTPGRGGVQRGILRCMVKSVEGIYRNGKVELLERSEEHT